MLYHQGGDHGHMLKQFLEEEKTTKSMLLLSWISERNLGINQISDLFLMGRKGGL